ncbi:hypothetical protein WDU94_000172 [Cyamophila willieti]
MKTCWRTLPPFKVIGDALMKKYYKTPTLQLALLKRSGRSTQIQRPRRAELVYLESSPNYCERDLNLGSLGTVGRHCNRTSRGMDGCDLMCCGRGYNTHQISRAWQCRCKFHWCCYVQCDTCTERIEVYTCK